jgi:hypothetical protein
VAPSAARFGTSAAAESSAHRGITDEVHGQLSQMASLRLLSRNALDAT